MKGVREMKTNIEIWDYGINYGRKGPQLAQCQQEEAEQPRYGHYGSLDYHRCGADAVKGVSWVSASGSRCEMLLCQRHLDEKLGNV